uniref:Uncharacterized protein n=1 Tax=Mycena chlorophos TaxID=658473 RepID=A0ABQ0KZI2_MYCCL|nr:predicted protein [Mycena chlorophos]
MVENKLLPKDLPSVKSNGGFPYSFSDGTHALLCKPATDRLVAHLQDKTNRDCHLCGEKKITNWRVHIGTHLYRFQRGMDDELLDELEHGHACGFCGRCNAPECTVSLTRTQSSFNVVSQCPRYSEFRYGSAETMASRNIPVVCTLCHPSTHKRNETLPAHWRYNMRLHLKEEHPQYASPDNPDGLHPLPHALWENIRIQSLEEEKLGIPEALRSAPFSNVEPPPNESAPAAGGKKKSGGRKRKAAAAGLPESSQTQKRTNNTTQ